MPDSNTITPSNGQYLLTHTTNASGDYTAVFATENRFVEHNIAVKITTPAAQTPRLTLGANTTDVTVGSTVDANGKYAVTATLGGTVAFDTAGWIGTGNSSVSANNVQVGEILQSTLSSSSITPSASEQRVTIGAGYYPDNRTITIAANSDGPAGTVTSGSATITSLTYAAGTNANNFTITGSADVGAPTVGTAGYISLTAGTKNANEGGATVSTTVAKIVGTAAISGTTTYSPSISKETTFPNGVTDASTNDAATTTTPSSGVYVAVKSSGSSWQVTSTPVVTTAGYGTNDKHGIAGDTQTITVNSSGTTYIKIKTAPRPSLSVTDLSGSDDVAISDTKDSNNKYTITANNLSVTGTIGVTAAGWFSGDTGITDQEVNAVDVGKIAEAVISGSSTNATASIQADPGTISVTRQDTPNGATIINAGTGSSTTTPTTNGVYAVVKASVAANNTPTTGPISGSGTAVVSSVGYAPDSLTGTISVSGTASATVNSKEGSSVYIPITTATMPATAASSVTTGYSSQATIGFTTTAQYLHIPHGYNKSDIYYTINGVSMGNVSTSSTDPGNTYTALTGNNAPVVPSGGYLLINAGYHNNTKISLADIVPDDATFAVVSGQSADLLYGKTAYDNAGALVTGTIRTYDGAYTET